MPGNYQGQVMWPRLVANKILNKRSFGSTNFVVDFPTNTETLTDVPILDQPSLCAANLLNHHKGTQNYKVFVSTWNVGGIAPNEDLDMEDWLEASGNICDIYVLGYITTFIFFFVVHIYSFQEIVPLRASNVLGSENCKISTKWNSLITQALNKKIHSLCGGKPLQNRHPNQEFLCVISKQMVGILISVWIRNDLRPYIQNPSVSCVGCGIMGCLGNKGSVSVRFQLHETSFCFVCSHLASGDKEGDEKHRNSDVSEILNRTSFSKGPLLDLPRKILDHDRIILLGDLNYRISLPEAAVRLLMDKKEWNTLIESDQLRMELMNGQAFEGWQEGIIKFDPTYKYCPNSDVYFGCLEGKKGEKWRAPAWCDRIIWYGEGLKQHLYTRGESNLSDHRPVKALFSVKVEFLRPLDGLGRLFRSEGFDEIASKLEMQCII